MKRNSCVGVCVQSVCGDIDVTKTVIVLSIMRKKVKRMSNNDDYEKKVKAFLDALHSGFEDLILDKMAKDLANAIIDNIRNLAEDNSFFKDKDCAIYGRIIAILENEMSNQVGDIEVEK